MIVKRATWPNLRSADCFQNLKICPPPPLPASLLRKNLEKSMFWSIFESLKTCLEGHKSVQNTCKHNVFNVLWPDLRSEGDFMSKP